MDSQNLSYKAGQTQGQAQEKTSNMASSAANAMHSVKDSTKEAGNQVKAMAESGVDTVRSKTNT